MFFIGDVHADVNELMNKIIRYKVENSTLIQVGDFGAGFKNTEVYSLFKLKSLLTETKNVLYIMRGNHDNPSSFWTTQPLFSGDNLFFVPDYTELNVENKKLLLIGGGTSIDRIARTEGSTYWSDEGILFDKSKINNPYDILVTHVPLKGIFEHERGTSLVDYYIKKDNTLKDILKEEEEILELINNNVDYNVWVSGHYHSYGKKVLNNKIHINLDSMQFYEM